MFVRQNVKRLKDYCQMLEQSLKQYLVCPQGSFAWSTCGLNEDPTLGH